jgi:hypothetical protein
LSLGAYLITGFQLLALLFLLHAAAWPLLLARGLDHRSPPKEGEFQPTWGYYHFLKLDNPLREDNGGGCGDLDEILIFLAWETDAWPAHWEEQHITIEGKLGRFPSALAYPSIYIELSEILEHPN